MSVFGKNALGIYRASRQKTFTGETDKPGMSKF
jgi:hypothetical protein